MSCILLYFKIVFVGQYVSFMRLACTVWWLGYEHY